METTDRLNSFLNPNRKPLQMVGTIPSFVERISGEEAHWNRIYNFMAPFYERSERSLGSSSQV